jgi:hypothetical protein
MAEQPIEIPIKLGGLSEIKKELKDIRGQIIASTDPKEMEALAKRAGELTDSIRDANEQINIFAGGSGFEKLSNNLGDIGGKIASLDFAGASESARLLSTNIKGLDPAEISTQIKGLASTVGSLGKAFFQMGLQILTNPIFILTATITAVVVAVGVFLNKLGLLKPILDTIKNAIGGIVRMFEDLTDWLGITDNAGERYAKNELERLNKLTAKNKEFSKGKVTQLEQEMQIQKAYGVDVTKIEKEKRQELVRTAEFEFNLLNEKINNRALLSKMSKEELAELKKQFKESKDLLRQAKVDLRVLDIETDKKVADDKKKINDKAREEWKKNNEQHKANLKKAKEEAVKIEAERIANIRQLENDWLMELEQLEQANYNRGLSQSEIEIQAIQDKYFRMEEMARGNVEQLKIIEEAKLNELNDVAVKEEQLRLANQEKQLADEKKFNEERIANEKAIRDAKIQLTQETFNGLNALGNIFIKDSKKLEQFNKASALVQIGIDTARAISSLVASSQANPTNAVTFGLSGAVQFATGIVQILTNIAKAKQLLTNPQATPQAGGGATAPPTVVPQVPQQATPQVNLFGGANPFNNTSQGGVMRVYVAEGDITNTQNKVNKFEQLTVL